VRYTREPLVGYKNDGSKKFFFETQLFWGQNIKVTSRLCGMAWGEKND